MLRVDKKGRKVQIIGFPISLGSKRKGTQLAPKALRRSGLALEIKRLGIRIFDSKDVRINNSKLSGKENARNLDEVLGYCTILGKRIEDALSKGRFPVVIGGDHTCAIGSILGLHSYSKGRCGAIYFDAHPDFNTPSTTPSGNVHGMTLSLMSGQYRALASKPLMDVLVDPKKIAIVGVRSIDSGEKKLLAKAKVRVFTADDVQRMGIKKVAREAIKIASAGNAPLYVSLDMDAIDPAFAPGTGTPVVGGLLPREVKMALREIYKSKKMMLFELAELNPLLDVNNITLEAAKEMILVALGKGSP